MEAQEKKERMESLVNLDLLVLLAKLAHQDLLAKEDPLGLLELKADKERRAPRVRQELRAHQVKLGQLALRALLESLVLKVYEESLVLWVNKDFLVLLDKTAHLDQWDLLVSQA